MHDFIFLTIEQLFGEDELKIIKKRGTKAAITDFAILLGADKFIGSYIDDSSKTLENRACSYWTSSYTEKDNIYIVNLEGHESSFQRYERICAARPAFHFSSTDDLPAGTAIRRANDGILEVEYGSYPQQAVDKIMQNKLNDAFENQKMKKTGNIFTVDSRRYNAYDKNFLPKNIDEYEYQGRRYVRVKAASRLTQKFTLSNGEKYKTGDVVWLEVTPVKWLVDEKEKIMVSEKLLFAGVPFNCEKNHNYDFRTTTIKQFMDESFSKNLFQTMPITLLEKQNPYNFNFDEVSEEDIIKGALMSNVSVFLHGRSSEGKSARVKQFDPDCEIIYLRNATPDSLNGKSVYNSETGEMIDVPPTWYKKICKKCEDEPNKIHIIFFDEITNALPSIQGMAFNIILDGEINGIWKLPKNARIVAAGNDLNDSLAANTMAEPLFNRFAHVYINTTVDSWLKWASTPNEEYERLDYKDQKPKMKIHSAIYSYVAYKSYSKKDVLRTPYNGEKPNADPRKWEMASKVLYATGKPEMLRSLVGEDLTKDFVEFCKQKVITVQDVINNNYNDSDLQMSVSEKFATAVGLSSVDENNLEVVREFVYKLGAEIGATFDSIWAHGDEIRLEKLAEIKMKTLSKGEMKR